MIALSPCHRRRDFRARPFGESRLPAIALQLNLEQFPLWPAAAALNR